MISIKKKFLQTNFIAANRGFSLLELLVVLAIVSIIGAFAVPVLQSQLRRGDLRLQSLDVREAITRARYLASSRQECVLVQITGSTVEVTAHHPGANKSCVLPLGEQTMALDKVSLRSGVTIGQFSNGSSSVIFNTTGGLEEKTVIKLNITQDIESVEIVIYPAIGQIRMR